MKITEIKIQMVPRGRELLGYASVTIEGCLVIRNIKIISGSARRFIAMPSRKFTARCPRCADKNHRRANFCNQCGLHLEHANGASDAEGNKRYFADIVYPIDGDTRSMMERTVLAAYDAELDRSMQPNYQPTHLQED